MQSFNPFEVDFYKLAAWLIPKNIRKPKFVILVKACFYPLIYAHQQFIRYRDTKLYQLSITPQVCFMEKMLNDRFDFTQRRIYITDADWHLPWFLFQEEELKPSPLFREQENKPVALFAEGEAGAVLNDFVVMVPASLTFSTAEMRSLIDSYKLFGTQYTIQTF